jgi:hypothetical protein
MTGAEWKRDPNRGRAVPSRPPGQGPVRLEQLAGDMQMRIPKIPGASRLRRLAPIEKLLGSAEPTEPEREPVYRPGDTVPASGVYNLVAEDGEYLRSQITCHEGAEFPPTQSHLARERDEPLDGDVRPHYGYRLAYVALHPAPARPRDEHVYRPGDVIPASGVYNVVDAEGESMLHQRACVHGKDHRTGGNQAVPGARWPRARRLWLQARVRSRAPLRSLSRLGPRPLTQSINRLVLSIGWRLLVGNRMRSRW